MAFVGHLGPRSAVRGPIRPLWPNPMQPKGGSALALKARWVPNPIKTLRIHFWPWTTFQPVASGNHQRPPDELRNPSPQLKGDFSHSSMHPLCKVAGVVHTWYYIPLCTIFDQQFNGDVFRIKFHNSKSSSQDPTPISKEDSSAHQSGNPWWLSEEVSRAPTTWPCRSWVGNLFKIIPRAILRGYSSLISCQGSKYFNNPWTTQLVHTGSNELYLYVLGPIRPIHIPLWEFNHTIQFSRWPELYWPH
ncbi:hypothetical protein O181_121476 [Austropuccinia psidii MF-1]|uniref:Uncharacterized protein n=1 Tax=Austropuccinia psidii MF-1 TaxID=1389203 RepID=A0A9Q3KJP8_9BASI|nr:hypothetical protein [Austropuccinia psidii MF-1]